MNSFGSDFKSNGLNKSVLGKTQSQFIDIEIKSISVQFLGLLLFFVRYFAWINFKLVTKFLHLKNDHPSIFILFYFIILSCSLRKKKIVNKPLVRQRKGFSDAYLLKKQKKKKKYIHTMKKQEEVDRHFYFSFFFSIYNDYNFYEINFFLARSFDVH